MQIQAPSDSRCRYCSVVSKAKGEDPIGTAVPASQWLLIEVPQPWAKDPWQDQPALLSLFAQIEQRPRRWQQLRILAIAPDRQRDRPDARHVFFYQQPVGPATGYAQHRYQVPTAQLSNLVQALLFQPDRLQDFVPYQQPTVRQLFVCTHTRYDLACGRFGTPLYRLLKQRYAHANLQVWQTTHFGGHQFAPTLIDFPTGQFWGHLQPTVLDALVYRQGDLAQLRPHYRGWGCLSRWEQVAERAIWMQQGWPWLSLPKTSRIIRRDPGFFGQRLLLWCLAWIPSKRAQILLKKLDHKLTWAEIEICWEEGPDWPAGCYRAQVSVSHQLLSQLRSGDDQPLSPVKQYQVTEI
ncbi:MAG: sucrase ferredoxin [Leptolyngbya sp. SIO4C1]|nr:sucrase ferredoxin [Leptolyngbya sp. SIO4C1]